MIVMQAPNGLFPILGFTCGSVFDVLVSSTGPLKTGIFDLLNELWTFASARVYISSYESLLDSTTASLRQGIDQGSLPGYFDCPSAA